MIEVGFFVIFADVIELMSLSSETEFRLFGSGLKYTPEHRDAFKNQVWLLSSTYASKATIYYIYWLKSYFLPLMEGFVLLSIEVKSWSRSSDHTCNISASLPNCRLGRGPYQLIFRSNVPINPWLHQFQGHPLVHLHKRYNWTSQGRRHQTLTVRQHWKFYSCFGGRAERLLYFIS